MHSNNPVYGGEDDNQYPFAGTWNKVRGFLEENIQLFQEKLIKIIWLHRCWWRMLETKCDRMLETKCDI